MKIHKNDLVIMIGQADEDLRTLAQAMQKVGKQQITLSSEIPKRDSRIDKKVRTIAEEAHVYVVAHGNEEGQWGAAGDTVEIEAADVLEYLHDALPENIVVFFCICHSWEYGKIFKREAPNRIVIAARDCPTLTWDENEQEVRDDSKKMAQVKNSDLD